MTIPFNKAYFDDKELSYIQRAFENGKVSGDGAFTQLCHRFFQKRYGFEKVLLTSSCTDALEMAALLSGIAPGDEIILPSFTFPSTANAFLLRGAKAVFADSGLEDPNIGIAQIAPLVTERTKAIVVVHYAGVACDMDPIMKLAEEKNLFVIEDAAHAVDSYYKGRPLGSIGHFGTFSFHESKNISSGEGGMLAINDNKFIARAEIVREKGTNRSAFFRGEVAKYNWVDVGSSFLPSDITAAVLYAQLEKMDAMQQMRIAVWNHYYKMLEPLAQKGYFKLPCIPSYATNNAHLFYLLFPTERKRQALIDYLKAHGIVALFHYLSLHSSDYFRDRHDGRPLSQSQYYTDCLLRLPLYCGLTLEKQNYIIEEIYRFYNTPFSTEAQRAKLAQSV